MKAINDNTGTPVAKGLNVLLRVAMIFMTLAVFLLVSFGIILTTENSISADILNTLSETNSEIVTQKASLAFFGSAVVAMIWLFVLSVLRKIVRTLLNGDPFIPENISRLRLIWIVIALSEIVANNIMTIRVNLDRVLLDRRMSLTELAGRVGITLANLSILKTGKARAVRFSTLDALCRELDCQPADILVYEPDENENGAAKEAAE